MRSSGRKFDRQTVCLRAGLLAVGVLAAVGAQAQWTHRYQKLSGVHHNVYVEGHELPVLNAGPSDPAPSPDGKSLAIAARGWIWLLDLATGEARRLTRGGLVDSRPTWSPDGRTLAFVRDDSRTLAVMLRNPITGAEREVERGFAMDPAFSPDGSALYYSSAVSGGLDIWRIDLASGEKTRITSEDAVAVSARPHPDSKRLVYVFKTVNAAKRRAGDKDEIRVRSLVDGSETVLASGLILGQVRIDLSPDGGIVAYTIPGVNGLELRLVSIEYPGLPVRLDARDNGSPLSPAWSADGRNLYFMEAGRNTLGLYRISKAGGSVAEVPVLRWNWDEPTGRVIVRTRLRGHAGPAAARIGAVDGTGHPLIPGSGRPWFDYQNGLVYFYSPGVIELTAPAGPMVVSAVQGLATPLESAQVQVSAGQTREIDLELKPLWDARAAGWYSGDHHFHVHTAGQYPMLPKDLPPLLQGEGLDVATPMLANVANRFEEYGYWSWHKLDAPPLIRMAQEVRPSLGHIGLVGMETIFWPWTYGPSTQVYRSDDLTNIDPLAHARREEGISTYVHPVRFSGDPFDSEAGLDTLPLQLVADGVLGKVDAIEVASLVTDDVAGAAVWKRLLSIGVPIALNAGTDAMSDFYRTVAIGASRIYVRPQGSFDFHSYLAALKAGRSFVTNGPLVQLRVGGAQPGDVLPQVDTQVPFTLDLQSAVPAESVAILVNGAAVWNGEGVAGSGSKQFTGAIRVPVGGWIAAEVRGAKTRRWPAMDSYAYAITSPVWLGSVGSTEPPAARAAARDLLRALDVAERRTSRAYAGAVPPSVRGHFAKARASLQALLTGR